MPLPEILFRNLVEKSLTEDLGSGGDITSDRLIKQEVEISAGILARQQGVLAGDMVAGLTFDIVDSNLSIDWKVSDGQVLSSGTIVAVIVGAASSILKAERTALNFLGHLSGVATATNEMVVAVAGTNAKICCTRKTTPGLRALEKYAVRVGGGVNHRYGLDGGVLIKDNHIAISGGVSNAFKMIGDIGPDIGVEIEVDTLEQFEEALSCGARSILLDNMDNATLSEAVKTNNGKALLEASGNVTLDSVGAIAATGVDYISSGWITHSSPVLDFGLDLAF
ncbi:MAG TPA: carboxylating nicotinate-nucleotide diphosphorylase [Gemmatimonadetes bacterium]|nr:carboxylating nicotinate-nucleotide diphosphorylase [Gemmatimonadota bacterium]